MAIEPLRKGEGPISFDELEQRLVEREALTRGLKPGWIHYELEPEVGEGWLEVCRLAPGAIVCVSDFVWRDQVVPAVYGEALVKLHIRLSGESQLQSPFGEPIAWKRLAATLFIEPMRETPLRWAFAESRQKFVTLFCRLEVVRELLEGQFDDMPRALAAALAGEEAQLHSQEVPLTPEMLLTASSLFDPGFEGPLRPLHVKATALDLLCLTLRALSTLPADTTAPIPLSARDLRRLHEARDILVARLSDPPTIAELSRAVAVNQKKLKLGFRHVFGVTIFEYLQNRRLEAARQMLVETELQVSEVAMRIGYEHPTSFTAAFKKHFGYLPKRVRAP